MVSSVSGAGSAFAANERLYPSKLFLGTWGGQWDQQEKFSLTVTEVKAGKATVKYQHNGKTEIGIGTITKNILTYGAIQLATRDGKKAVAVANYGGAEKKAVLAKAG